MLVDENSGQSKFAKRRIVAVRNAGSIIVVGLPAATMRLGTG